ncbi:MAG: type II 3-dehydroquinate dehydratase [Gammaproteobacteria bacterium]
MSRLLLLNGPNLNLLGEREPDLYGRVTLDSIEARCRRLAEECGHELDCFQSNAEHELVQRVQGAPAAGINAIVINPAAFTHTSIALRDALTAVGIPFIEVHLSNVHGREAFRRRSYFSAVAAGVISGLGPLGYELAIRAADALLRGTDRN